MMKKTASQSPALSLTAGALRTIDFDNTCVLFEKGYQIVFVAKPTTINSFYPHGVKYKFNLFAPNLKGQPRTPILRFDNEHAPDGVKHPYDHWHPPRRGPGGAPFDVEKPQPLKCPVEELPALFFEKSYALLAELGINIDAAQLLTLTNTEQSDKGAEVDEEQTQRNPAPKKRRKT